ncbi:hypothetical protein NWE61_05795 [Mycoplasmopsis felis]|nr:hypothetical protein [Mycoplasmopsis felis]MCU9934587.1 hypothetical protein [Mycoplasmopsis felis]
MFRRMLCVAYEDIGII